MPSRPRGAAASRTTKFIVAVGAALSVLLFTSGCTSSAVPGPTSRPIDGIPLRTGLSATLLPDGTVLLVGGQHPDGAGGAVFDGELIRVDPSTSTSTTIGKLQVPRSEHSATLLANGEVLVAGGMGADGPLASAELIDPGSGASRLVAPMMAPRWRQAALLLEDGRVLVAGGVLPPAPAAEIFDPARTAFSPVASDRPAAFDAALARTTSSRVIRVMGQDVDTFDPASDSFVPLLSDRDLPTAPAVAALPENRLALIGGLDVGRGATVGPSVPASRKIFVLSVGPAAQLSPATDLPVGRVGAIVLAESNGELIVAGGTEEASVTSPTRLDRLAQPVVARLTLAGKVTALPVADGFRVETATLLGNGRVLVTGVPSNGGPGAFVLTP